MTETSETAKTETYTEIEIDMTATLAEKGTEASVIQTGMWTDMTVKVKIMTETGPAAKTSRIDKTVTSWNMTGSDPVAKTVGTGIETATATIIAERTTEIGKKIGTTETLIRDRLSDYVTHSSGKILSSSLLTVYTP